MFERFTEAAIKVIMLAQEEARRAGYNRCGSEQILLGLYGEGNGIAAQELRETGLRLGEIRSTVEDLVGPRDDSPSDRSWMQRILSSFKEIPLTEHAKTALELSWDEARQHSVNYIGTEHLLLGLLRINEGRAAEVLQRHGIDRQNLRDRILDRLSNSNLDDESKNPFAGLFKKRPFDSFDETAIAAVFFAQEEARTLGHNFVGSEQLLVGLLRQEGSIAAIVLKSLGVSLESAQNEVVKIISYGDGQVDVHIPFTPRAKRNLELACDEAKKMGSADVRTEHLLLGLIREGDGVGPRVLENLGVDLRTIRPHVMRVLKNESAT